MRRYWILIILLLIPLIPIGLYALGVIKRPVRTPKPIEFTIWTVTEDTKAFEDVIKQYNALRPYIKIRHERVSAEDYATKLKDAWARGKGPDVFAIPASWIGEFSQDFITPLPATTKVYNYETKKIFLRQETEVKQVTIPSLTPRQVQSDFADVVADDVVRDGKIYGLPLALDTLVLYYNRDILRSANIVEPPKTWGQLVNVIPKITNADEEGKILQSAIAIGTGKNVRYSPDIISLLFLQDGVTMETSEGLVRLDDSLSSEGTNLGVNALLFYSSFANTGKSVYSWNATQPDSLEAFIRGKTAMYIGYGADRDEISTKSSTDFGVAPIPHLQEDGKDALFTPAGNALQVNYGNYWALSVFQRTKNPNEAWNFVQFMTKQDRIAKLYLKATNRVGALRSILAEQTTDPDLGVLAQQAISARSWYHGRNAVAVEQYLRDMLDNAASAKMTIGEALALARKQIEQTTKKQR